MQCQSEFLVPDARAASATKYLSSWQVDFCVYSVCTSRVGLVPQPSCEWKLRLKLKARLFSCPNLLLKLVIRWQLVRPHECMKAPIRDCIRLQQVAFDPCP